MILDDGTMKVRGVENIKNDAPFKYCRSKLLVDDQFATLISVLHDKNRSFS